MKAWSASLQVSRAARLRVQVHARGEAAGHEHQIARLRLALTQFPAAEARQFDGAHAPAPVGAEHAGPGEHRDAGGARASH